jgi:rhamnulokinase/L-fuculokinase
MVKAEELVRRYAEAGFGKIHLDTSMRLADDDPDAPLSDEVIAGRAARLAAVCERAAKEKGREIEYIVGSEVPVPGGTQDVCEEALAVTSPEDFERSWRAFGDAFTDAGLADAFSRIVGVVVQPGVEFGDDSVQLYDRAAAAALTGKLKEPDYRSVVFEGHSTDYQPRERLREMVEDGVAILKVGPALTFGFREALFALARIEEELALRSPSRFRETLDEAMLARPDDWERYYRGTEEEQRLKRAYSLSDRSRYYYTDEKVRAALGTLFANIDAAGVPSSLLSQYLPTAYARLRGEGGRTSFTAADLARARVRDFIDDYLYAAGGATDGPRRRGRAGGERMSGEKDIRPAGGGRAAVKRVVAFDLGASGGRAMLAEYTGSRIRMREIHRFRNEPVRVGGTMYWDILFLFRHIEEGIAAAAAEGPVASLGIDTWGVDFGLIGRAGDLLSNAVHYRDGRTDDYRKIYDLLSREELYRRTGIQEMQINTLHQLYYLKRERPELLELTDKLLFIPDLLAYFLTGEKQSEYTIASTSELLEVYGRDWDADILARTGLRREMFCGIVLPGASCGRLRGQVRDETGAGDIEVLSVASHDTASAVLAVPAREKDFIFLSCGTWSLLGTELDAPCTDEKALRYRFTNEGGAAGKILFMKNIMGSWLLQESRRQWKAEGRDLSYEELDALAEQAPPLGAFVDVDDPAFLNPVNAPVEIGRYCERFGRAAPSSIGGTVRCIYESLALKYRRVVEELEACVGRAYDVIYMVGGGTRSALLCRLTADATGRRVIVGSPEATALGNSALQFVAGGDLEDVRQARLMIADAEPVKRYERKDGAAWEEAYARYLSEKGEDL